MNVVFETIIMRTAHLVLVHKNAIQLERLLNAMHHCKFDFYIHLDKKVSMKDFVHLQNLPNVYFIKERVDVKWGGYSLMKATFNGINEICHTNIEYNFINFMTGQDYPIKPIDDIFTFFQENVGYEFIKYKDILSDWKEAQSRYKKYHLTEFRFKGATQIERVLNYFSGERKMPYGYHPFGESVFSMLSPEVALFVVDTVLRDKKINSFFKYVWGGDEFLFQTIILNSRYMGRVINNNFRYIDWSEQKANPKVLTNVDFERLQKSAMLFARKFDVLEDQIVLDNIDAKILTKRDRQ